MQIEYRKPETEKIAFKVGKWCFLAVSVIICFRKTDTVLRKTNKYINGIQTCFINILDIFIEKKFSGLRERIFLSWEVVELVHSLRADAVHVHEKCSAYSV